MNTKDETLGSVAGMPASNLDRGHANIRLAIGAVLALWFGLVLFLGARGAFIQSAGSPPVPIFFGLAIPLAVFLLAYFSWNEFRDFVLGADLRLVAAIQGWRWAGLGFLSLYAYGVLPGLFALPAGLGDMAIGVSAPWMVLALIRNPSFAASRRYVTWNILGLVDFVVAVSMAVLCSGFVPGIAALNGNVTTSPMAQLPLILIPAYLVPVFSMLHLIALFQARKLVRSRLGIPSRMS